MEIWGLEINSDLLTDFEVDYLRSLPESIQSMSWVCTELDRIWNDLNLNNLHDIAAQPIGKYYSHPVWLMNGIFSARDNESLQHRQAIANFVRSIPNKSVADYGGGFGELALAISRTCPNTQVSIVEPFPTKIGKNRVENDKKIKFRFDLDGDNYDVIIAQDVLEHVSDPLKLAYEISKAVRLNGTVVFANCFYPVIQCHLPCTFHLRHTFKVVMKFMGLQYVGTVSGAPHAYIFKKIGKLSLSNARRIESIAKFASPILNGVVSTYINVKQLYKYFRS